MTRPFYFSTVEVVHKAKALQFPNHPLDSYKYFIEFCRRLHPPPTHTHTQTRVFLSAGARQTPTSMCERRRRVTYKRHNTKANICHGFVTNGAPEQARAPTSTGAKVRPGRWRKEEFGFIHQRWQIFAQNLEIWPVLLLCMFLFLLHKYKMFILRAKRGHLLPSEDILAGFGLE